MKSVLAGLILLVTILGCAAGKRTPPKSAFDKSPDTQEKRRQAIRELTQRGVFDRIDHGSTMTRAWVKPAFYLLKFDQKKDVMNVVCGYYCESDIDVVLIKDAYSGKTVGSYSLTLGLELE